MYGTVMTGRLRGSFDDAVAELKEWEATRHVAGYVDAQLLLGDDGVTLVNTVRFTDKAAYQALADDPEQARWYAERMAPLLDGEPTWVDGTWADR
jgi:hypothetical protein